MTDKEAELIGKFFVGLVAVILGLVLFISCAVMLGIAERGVAFDKFSGKMKGELHQGFNLINPLTTSVTIYDLKIVRDDFINIEGLSSDMQTIELNIGVNWKLDPARLNDIYQTIHGPIKETIMNIAVVDTAKAELGKFRIEDIARNRDKLRAAIEATLKSRLAERYILIDSVSIVNVDYSNEYEAAINAKLVAEQKALEFKNIKEQVRYQAEAKAIENQNIAATITPLVLKQKWIEKWDGHLPTYMLGENTSMLLEMAR